MQRIVRAAGRKLQRPKNDHIPVKNAGCIGFWLCVMVGQYSASCMVLSAFGCHNHLNISSGIGGFGVAFSPHR